jgi:hypothetical protein
MEIAEKDSITKKDLTGMVLYWRITEKYGGRKIKEDWEDIDAANDLF